MKNYRLFLLIISCNYLLASYQEIHQFMPCAHGRIWNVNEQKLSLYKKMQQQPELLQQINKNNRSYKCVDLANDESQVNLTGFPLSGFIRGTRYCFKDRVIGIEDDAVASHEVIMVPYAKRHTCMIEHSRDNRNRNFIKIFVLVKSMDEKNKRNLEIDSIPLNGNFFIYLTTIKRMSSGLFLHCVNLDKKYQTIFQFKKNILENCMDYGAQFNAIYNGPFKDFITNPSEIPVKFLKNVGEKKEKSYAAMLHKPADYGIKKNSNFLYEYFINKGIPSIRHFFNGDPYIHFPLIGNSHIYLSDRIISVIENGVVHTIMHANALCLLQHYLDTAGNTRFIDMVWPNERKLMDEDLEQKIVGKNFIRFAKDGKSILVYNLDQSDMVNIDLSEQETSNDPHDDDSYSFYISRQPSIKCNPFYLGICLVFFGGSLTSTLLSLYGAGVI